MAVTKYESYYAKISENIKGIREYNEYNTGVCEKISVN
jgi:hypothetical protein